MVQLTKAGVDAATDRLRQASLADQESVYAARRTAFRTEVERRLQQLGFSAGDYQHLTESDYSCSASMLARCSGKPWDICPDFPVLEDLSIARAYHLVADHIAYCAVWATLKPRLVNSINARKRKIAKQTDKARLEKIADLAEEMAAKLADLQRIGKIEAGVLPFPEAYGGIPELRRRIVDPDGMPRDDLQFDDGDAAQAVHDWRRTVMRDLAAVVRAGPGCDLPSDLSDEAVLNSPEAIFSCSKCDRSGMCRTSTLFDHDCLDVPMDKGVEYSSEIILPSRYLSLATRARAIAFAVVSAVGLDVDRTTLSDLDDYRFVVSSAARPMLGGALDDDGEENPSLADLFNRANAFGLFVRWC